MQSKRLIWYGPCTTKSGESLEAIDLGDAFFEFIHDVLIEYESLTSEEKIAYEREWDLMAHGPTEKEPTKWDTKPFQKYKKYDLSEEVKASFVDEDANAALLCRLLKIKE